METIGGREPRWRSAAIALPWWHIDVHVMKNAWLELLLLLLLFLFTQATKMTKQLAWFSYLNHMCSLSHFVWKLQLSLNVFPTLGFVLLAWENSQGQSKHEKFCGTSGKHGQHLMMVCLQSWACGHPFHLQLDYSCFAQRSRVLSRFWYRRPRNVNRRLLTRPDGP